MRSSIALMAALSTWACSAEDVALHGGSQAGVGGSAQSSSSHGGSGSAQGGSAQGGSAPSGLPYACPPDLLPCPAFPGASWETKPPAEVGLDDAALDAFVAATGNQHGVVVRYGYLVKSWGNASGKLEWASASKPVFATLLLFAVQEGKLDSVDDGVAEFGWSLAPADQTMTFRHLANMVSGYGLGEAPGEAWAYNDYAIKLYTATLFERVFTEGTADDVALQPQRLGPLSFEDGDVFALKSGAPRVTTTPRDFARIGWLWVNHGHWNGAQLLPASDFVEHMRPGVPASLPRTAGGAVDDYLGIGTAGGGADQSGLGPGIYGFNWWFNPNRQTWPSAPADTVQANGHWNGEVQTIIPSLGLVAAWKGSGANPESFDGPMNVILEALAAAVIE